MKNFWEILLYNIAFVGAWHVVAFVLCVYGSPSWFDFRRKRYQMFKWEKNGKWYVKYLKIKLWKDLVPTHVGKQGFSKDHLDTEDLSIHYLAAFLLETCRGEWDHSLCAFCAVPVVIFNPFPLGLIFGFLILLGNLPFVAIQRYNRIRLLTLRKRRVREMERCKVNA